MFICQFYNVKIATNYGLSEILSMVMVVERVFIARSPFVYRVLACLLGVLQPNNIEGHIRMDADVWQCTLVTTLHYSAVHLEDRVTSTTAQYPTQSHYLDTIQTSPCPILLIMPDTRLCDCM